MELCFLKDEDKEVINLINRSFNINCEEESLKLQPNQRFLLLKDNNKVVGVTLITQKNDPIKGSKMFYLDYVCVDEEYRGRGYGEKMIKEVERIAKEENINKIQLTSSKKRVSARNLYQKIGMKILDTELFCKEL